MVGSSIGKSKVLTIEEASMMMHAAVNPIISLIAGILILIFPTILNYIVAVYLILIGLIGILGKM